MILVVFGHNTALAVLYPPMISWIFLFHVPAFFFISGGFVHPERRLALASMAYRLLLPVFLTGLVLLVAKLLVRGGDPFAAVAGLLWATGATLPSSQLWFVPLLFLTLICLPGLIRLSATWPRRAAMLVALALTGYLSLQLPGLHGAEELRQPGTVEPTGLPWSMDLLPVALFFGYCGYLLRGRLPDPKYLILLTLAGFTLVTLAYFAGVRADLNRRLFADYIPALAIALVGSVALMSFAEQISRLPYRLPARLCSLIGMHSMAVFLFHLQIQNIAVNALPEWVAGRAWLGLIAGVFVPVALSVLFARVFPGKKAKSLQAAS